MIDKEGVRTDGLGVGSTGAAQLGTKEYLFVLPAGPSERGASMESCFPGVVFPGGFLYFFCVPRICFISLFHAKL